MKYWYNKLPLLGTKSCAGSQRNSTELNGTQREGSKKWCGWVKLAQQIAHIGHQKLCRNSTELNGTQREGSKKWVWMGEIGTTNCPYWAPEAVPELNGTQRNSTELNGKAPKSGCGWVKLAQQIAHIGHQKLCRNSTELNGKAPKSGVDG